MPTVRSRIRHDKAEAPGGKLPHPWWEHLPRDFANRPERFGLSLKQKAAVHSTALLDVGLRTAGACLVGGLALPLGFHPRELRRAMADRTFYGPMAMRRDPTAFFHAPPPVNVRARRARWLRRFTPRDGVCEVLHFESPFVPVNPRLRGKYLAQKRNRTAHARYWRHHRGPRPTIFAIHGFSADLYLVNEWFFALPWLYELGCDIVLVTLPFHGDRQSRTSPFSGHGYFAGGPSWINESVAQSVMDFRVLVDWLMRERGVQKVGVTGVSLGGYTSSILAATEPRLEFAIPNVPVVSLADLVLEWEPIGTAIRTGLKLMRKSIVDARHLLAVSNPLTYEPALTREQLMIVGGVGDRLAPPKHSQILWEHWNRCPIHWFPGSHLVHFDRGTYLRQMARFLGGLGFLPPR